MHLVKIFESILQNLSLPTVRFYVAFQQFLLVVEPTPPNKQV
jgi:hypothetical protein